MFACVLFALVTPIDRVNTPPASGDLPARCEN
jgi:hypothetical protein